MGAKDVQKSELEKKGGIEVVGGGRESTSQSG